MEYLKTYQSKYLAMLNSLYKVEKDDFAKLELIEDCHSLLMELNQLEIDSRIDKRKIKKKDLAAAIKDARDIDRFYNEYIN